MTGRRRTATKRRRSEKRTPRNDERCGAACQKHPGQSCTRGAGHGQPNHQHQNAVTRGWCYWNDLGVRAAGWVSQ